MRSTTITLVLGTALLGVAEAMMQDCGCENFREGLTTDDIGKPACAKEEVHGMSGVKTWCKPVDGLVIPHIDDGCADDMRRCRVSYRPPHFPTCSCFTYALGADPSTRDGLCQKFDGTCFARDYYGDRKIGGADFYGCPEDMHRCQVKHRKPHRPDPDEGETTAPTMGPTDQPTGEPTGGPTNPGDSDDETPSGAPTMAPTVRPTMGPTGGPTARRQ